MGNRRALVKWTLAGLMIAHRTGLIATKLATTQHPPDPGLHVAVLAFTVLTNAKIIEIAKSVGGTQALVEAAWANMTKWSAVRSDLIAGRLLGVTRTPGLFHNGYFLTPDGIPMDTEGFDRSLRSMILA